MTNTSSSGTSYSSRYSSGYKRKLQSAGYLRPGYPTDRETDKATQRFCRFHGIKGAEAAAALLDQRFCSRPDEHGTDAQKYVASGCTWPKSHLKYCHVSWHPSLPQDQLRRTFEAACKMWSDVCGVTFEEVSRASDADWTVGWNRIDGPGGTLAVANMPPPCGGRNAGNIRIDVSENWTTGEEGNLVQAMAHELGHGTIGLYHSPNRGSLMYAYSNGGGDKPNADDIAGGVAAYGPPQEPTTPIMETVVLQPTYVYEGRLRRSKDEAYFVLPAEVLASLREDSKLKVSLRASEDLDADVYSRWDAVPVVEGDLDETDLKDHGSWTPTGTEDYSITLSDEYRHADLFFLVQSYSGAGSFRLTITGVGTSQIEAPLTQLRPYAQEKVQQPRKMPVQKIVSMAAPEMRSRSRLRADECELR